MSGTHESHAGDGEQAAALSNVVVRLIREYTGRGPTRAHTHMGENLVTVVLRDSLTKGELSLVRDGLSDTVLKTRKAYQGTMRRELVAEVERITGRTVEAFLSDNHIDPDVGIEVFMLEAAQTPGSR